MVSCVEPWWAGLYALPFDGAQGDSLSFCDIIDSPCLLIGSQRAETPFFPS